MNRSIQRTPSHLRSWLRLLTCSCAAAAALISPARADDSEIYIAQSTVAPNILLILDTSGSMQGSVRTAQPYNPDRNYVSESRFCTGIADRVYFSSGDSIGTPPSCFSDAWIPADNNRCKAARTAIATTAGSYQADRFTQWRTNGGNRREWRTLQSGYRGAIDCSNDNGVDGDLSTTNAYPDSTASSRSDTAEWTGTATDSYWSSLDTGTPATLYSANYIAYYAEFQTEVIGTRLEVMQQAATSLLNAVSNINVGLMRYSVNTEGSSRNNPAGNGGGMILAPVAPIAQNRAELVGLINAFIPGGATPLSEALYEAHQYFSGGNVFFGDQSESCTEATSGTCNGDSETQLSVPASRVGGAADGANYASPATQACQKNYIVYLTDGEPNGDSKANSRIANLPDFDSLVGSCPNTGDGRCLGPLSEYMFEKDLRSGVDGDQNVTTYYIGFGDAFGGTSNSAFDTLKNAATRGGGQAYQAGDLSQLTKVFTDIFASISEGSSTLTAPTVAVNAFNRTQTLDDLYISVFQPSAGIHWPGNIKKYRIVDGELLARGDAVATGTNGLFLDSTSDYWSNSDRDGSKVELGGAAWQIPAPADRDLYTYLGTNPGTKDGVALKGNSQAAVNAANTLLDDAVLGTDDDLPLRDTLIEWARGADVDDENSNQNRTEARNDMGDPMHSQPAVVIYDGDAVAKTYDAVVFTATNDGYLHALSTKDNGKELWAFVPKEMLGGLKTLYLNDNTATKNYSIDGDLRVLKYDVDGDGKVEPADNDRVLLFFSTGRNRSLSRYYALDVTDKDSPRFLWSVGPDTLTGLGQAWSRPAITRVNIREGRQNTQKLVLIFGGGYDPAEENREYIADADVGNRVFMIDALYGRLLWSAGDDGTDLELERMKHSIPSAVNVVDLDGDGFGDRMYVGDMAAQLWRFDIFNGKVRSELVTGGVIASLGAKDAATVNAANTRRFYNAPDAALLQVGNARPFLNIAIGSGYRGHPLATDNQDRFYSIRDRQPFAMLTQQQYEDYDIVTETDLTDVTENLAPNIPANSPGWLLQLNDPTYQGEKVLAPATTLDNVLMFTTYTPNEPEANTCSVATGFNRAYFVSAFDARPINNNRDGSTGGGEGGESGGGGGDDPTRKDRYEDGGRNGIALGVTTLLLGDGQVTCVAGVKVLNSCKEFGSRIKTYWRQTNAN